jgi:transcription elongation factor GreA
VSQRNEVPITAEGLADVKRELDELITAKRPENIAKIKAAREHGDLSENFEYHSARNEQSFLETRIQELEGIVRNHVLVESRGRVDRIEVLATVTFAERRSQDEEDQPEETYRIVPPAEADPTHGSISYESAIGKALMGHRVGDEVEVQTPTGGSYTIQITKIE